MSPAARSRRKHRKRVAATGTAKKRVRLKKRVCICKYSTKLRPSLCAQLVDDLPLGHILRGYTRLPKSKIKFNKNMRQRYLFHLGVEESRLPRSVDQWICRIHFDENCFTPGPPVQIKESVPVTRRTHNFDIIESSGSSTAVPTPNAILKPKLLDHGQVMSTSSLSASQTGPMRMPRKDYTREAAAALIQIQETGLAPATKQQVRAPEQENQLVASSLQQAQENYTSRGLILPKHDDDEICREGSSNVLTGFSPSFLRHFRIGTFVNNRIEGPDAIAEIDTLESHPWNAISVQAMQSQINHFMFDSAVWGALQHQASMITAQPLSAEPPGSPLQRRLEREHEENGQNGETDEEMERQRQIKLELEKHRRIEGQLRMQLELWAQISQQSNALSRVDTTKLSHQLGFQSKTHAPSSAA